MNTRDGIVLIHYITCYRTTLGKNLNDVPRQMRKTTPYLWLKKKLETYSPSKAIERNRKSQATVRRRMAKS